MSESAVRAGRGPLRREHALLLAILGVAFAIRLWGLSWGLPHTWSLDEANKRDASLGPGIPRLEGPQPGFLYNSLYVIYRVAGAISPTLTDADYTYLGRLLMAVIGVLTVLGVWLVARELDDGDRPSAALPAAVLAAVLPFQTTMSRYIKEDGPLGLITIVVLLCLVRYWKVPSWPRLLLLGFAVGACFSTKFSAIAIFPVVGIAVLMVARREHTRPAELVGRLTAAAAAAIFGLLLVTPQYFFNPDVLWEGLEFQFSYSQTSSHDGITIPISPWSEWWTYYVRHGLIPGMTWPVFVLAIAGAVPLWRRPAGWTIVGSAVLAYLVLEQSVAKPAPFPARYLTPVVPLLCVQAGFAIQALLRRFATIGKPIVGLIVCALAFVVPPTVKSLMIAYEATHDTRSVAAAWMDAHWPRGTRILLIDNHMYLPPFQRRAHGWSIEERGDNPNLRNLGESPPYLVITSFRYQRYLDAPAADPKRTAYYRTVMRYPLVKKFEPTWLSYGFHSPTILVYRPAVPASP